MMDGQLEGDRVTVASDIRPYLRGALGVERRGGLAIPRRVFPAQLATLDAAGRGHRARATAGCSLDLVTDAGELSFDCEIVRDIDCGHELYGLVASHAPEGAPSGRDLVDCFAVEVDGGGARRVPAADGRITVELGAPDHARHEVRIWLPCIMEVAIGHLAARGSLEPAPRRGYLLALGDSITQGFVCGSPAATYPARAAAALGLDHVNQGIAGYVFDRRSLRGLEALRADPPRAITVCYGTNDWGRKASLEQVLVDAEGYLADLEALFPAVPTCVLTPPWRVGEDAGAVPCGMPLSAVREGLRDICARSKHLRFVDMGDAYPHDASLLADADLHPGAAAMGLMADRVVDAVRGEGAAEDGFQAAGFAAPDADDDASDGAAQTPAQRRAAACAAIDAETLGREHAPEAHPEWDRLVRTIWRLRQPDGCPWDKVQTHESIERDLIGEAYEAVDAIERHDLANLREELGDVLEQVLLQSQIAADAGEFDVDDVCRGLNEKLVRRHPHVFGDVFGTGVAPKTDDAGQVQDIWDDVKRAEREAAGGTDAAGGGAAGAEPGLLDSIPKSLPALMQAQKISKRAAKAGFEWEGIEDVWRQVAEEREEFEAEEPGSDAAQTEFGDMLFALVNVARREDIDAEAGLEASNRKFRRRWARMEAYARERGVVLDDLSTAELNELWDRAKAEERSDGRA